MPEGNFLKETNTKSPLHKTRSFEGAVITGRGWNAYENVLGISPEALKGETVLNFGAGASHLGRDLARKGINCEVIDLDLKFAPWRNSLMNEFRLMAYFPVHLSHLVSRFLNSQGEVRKKLFKLEKKVLDLEDRNFIQGNGRALPFPDQTFNHVLALWSTYQIPEEAKETVYRELMRVGKTLHMGPIFGKDYNILVQLASELGYEIVACQPVLNQFNDLNQPVMFSSSQDYEDYMRENDQVSRIQPPEGDNFIMGRFRSGVSAKGGNTIVLKRS